jgi:hypothetical protein
MKSGYVLFHFLLLLQLANGSQLLGQQQESGRLLRLYEDDDYINIKGRGTDEAYTNGSRIDIFYTKDRPSRFSADRIFPRAGDSSHVIYGWGIMQVMYTPRHIEDAGWQADDYPWSGGLFVTHSLYSYNPGAKYGIQTEAVLGVIGPASLAEQLQKGFHHLIHYRQPRGWGHQFRNDLLLNVNIAAEKQLFGIGSSAPAGPSLELIGGGRIYGGTMENRVSVYTLLRIGKMNPYFEGYLAQYSSFGTTGGKDHLQFYFILRPEASLVYTDALLEGGIFSGTEPYHRLRTFTYSVDYGAVLALRSFSISFTQNWSSALMKGLYSHEVGNISLYILL